MKGNRTNETNLSSAERIYNFLNLNDPLVKADAIFVCGGSSEGPVRKAAKLYHKKYADKIVFTSIAGTFGGDLVWNETETERYHSVLLDLQVPESAMIYPIDTKDQTLNTFLEANHVLPFMRSRGSDPRSIILVSRAVHQRRSWATFQKQNPDCKFINCSDNEGLSGELVPRMLLEMERLQKYAELGHLVRQEVPPEVRKSYEQLRQNMTERIARERAMWGGFGVRDENPPGFVVSSHPAYQKIKFSDAKYSVLVTGGAGFIGSHVVDQLLKLDCKVTVLDDLSGGFLENINPQTNFVQGSITDARLVKALFASENFDYVFHLAAYAAEGLSHFVKRFNYEDNLIGSINLINASVNHEIKCFVFTSSIAVYGSAQVPMREEIVPQPEDPYGIAKYAVELDLANTKRIFDLNYIIFRPHNVYGERQNIGDKYRNVIGIFMNQIMNGESLTIFGDGKQQRAFTYISDIAPLIARSIFEPKAYNQIFNIGLDKPVTVNEVAESVSRIFGVTSNINYLPPRKEVKNAFSDHSKLKNTLGYEAKVSLEQGLRKMARWAKEVGAKKSKNFDNIEIRKNLPPSWKA